MTNEHNELELLRARVRELESALALTSGRPAPRRATPPVQFLDWLQKQGPGIHWVPDNVLGAGLTQQARWSRLSRYCSLLLDAVHLGSQWVEWNPVLPETPAQTEQTK